MIKKLILTVLITLPFLYQPVNATIVPFATPSSSTPTTISVIVAKVVSINGSISKDKVILQWVVSENENAELFEVEKSTDGKNFSLAALVFGTDKAATDNYEFYEKKGKKKMIYRIKIINKNRTIEYSSVVVINPKA